ncbi:membrane-spanning 4-domains subfamily A member 4A-like isoform 1-T2 [Anomaloglossus baeobatrachus]|uniref:membrane-spanning 4-domains subfamily A member 4A-like n=1 Tax=Anomaloglossus baeobatrachus TaxID=238106 RepID=UPI003F50A0C9
MSTVVPDAGGVVVISQLRPRIGQGNEPEEEICAAPARMPKEVVTFYKGEPEVLGTTQIFTGIVLISFDIMVMTSGYLGMIAYSGVPIWAGILFIISGSLSVNASVKPTVGKVKASLFMNIVTTLSAGCGMIIGLIEFFVVPLLIEYELNLTYCAYYKSDKQCLGEFSGLVVYYGIISLNVLLFVLMFCISISTSVFACRTVCRSSFEEINVVIYQTTTLNVLDATRDVPPDSSADVSSALKTQT